ncbi:hypothetical protein BD311DRAFT_756633 [Dichomitus squalens]|uniref:Uncharacterized protein n=1 Tax=Dichomitus squalens TaxID=114155 RepID=A0A4Q9MP16_9APHY|nr:hypothetical protein BD311DRAFT_756633 [Dichomitus squalens]
MSNKRSDESKSPDRCLVKAGSVTNRSNRRNEKQNGPSSPPDDEPTGGRRRNTDGTGRRRPADPKHGQSTPSSGSAAFEAFGTGLGVVLASPFVLAGAAIFTGGAVLYGCGKMLEGIGGGLVAGPRAAFNAAVENARAGGGNGDEEEEQDAEPGVHS